MNYWNNALVVRNIIYMSTENVSSLASWVFPFFNELNEYQIWSHLIHRRPKLTSREKQKINEFSDTYYVFFHESVKWALCESRAVWFLVMLNWRSVTLSEERCDWPPERARWSHLARSELPAVSRKKNFPESHIINPLLTKLVWSRWLDIGLVLLFASL